MSDNENAVLDFEKTIVEIEEKINHLRQIAPEKDLDISKEIKRLEKKLKTHTEEIYRNLTPWQKAH